MLCSVPAPIFPVYYRNHRRNRKRDIYWDSTTVFIIVCAGSARHEHKFANGKGVFENNFVIEDGAPVRNWIAEDAKTLTITVYQNGFSESDEDVWQQVGDALTLDLTKLKKREKKK